MIVVGGGTAGAVLAGLLAAQTDQTVLLLEAGPDYGPFSGGAWPADLTDGSSLCHSHQWGYDSGNQYQARTIPFSRARVIGGCSAHNGCAAIWGHRADYDAWAALGNPGWSTEDLLPHFTTVSERLSVRIPGLDEVQPFQRIFLDAAPLAGIPLVENLNDLDEPAGVARVRPIFATVSAGTRHLPISILFDRARTCASWVIPWSTGSSSMGHAQRASRRYTMALRSTTGRIESCSLRAPMAHHRSCFVPALESPRACELPASLQCTIFLVWAEISTTILRSTSSTPARTF